MTVDWILFWGLALVAVISAIMMITSKNAVYSALFLVLNFATIAVMYLLLNAPFIAMVQVTVYAGAIMVLFLFVIMLLGVERVELTRSLPYQAPIAVGLGFAVLLLLGYAIVVRAPDEGALSVLADGFGGPQQVGTILFDQYLIPFEVTSVLLLVAMIGAIFLAGLPREGKG